jgi:hypothetical protein
MTLIKIYDVLEDPWDLKLYQDAQRHGIGFYPDFGIIGTDEWLAALADKKLEVKILEGVISNVYMIDDDFPMFELDDSREKTQWPQYGDNRRYLAGKNIRLKYLMVRERLNTLPVDKFHPLTLSIEIAD